MNAGAALAAQRSGAAAGGTPAGEWARYRRAPELGAEAMAAHFETHVYHRHSHDTYSFGVTEHGAQVFRCRGGDHVSTAGLVMAFNPDDPHDGHAGDPLGFTYQMVHVDPAVVRDVLSQTGDARRGLPLFPAPVLDDRRVAAAVRRVAAALLAGDPAAPAIPAAPAMPALPAGPDAPAPPVPPAPPDALAAQEALDALVLTVTGAVWPVAAAEPVRPAGAMAAVRDLLHAGYAGPITADDLARVAGRSRFQVYRQFRQRYGLPPSAYLRQLRLRAARRALAAGEPVAGVAAAVGFADQAHLTRWFRRTYGVTPALYQRAAGSPARRSGASRAV